nr:hypothetical protein [Kibdelosporangium sp. MJ126-NF4]CTQ94527.1 hypothetical protein [Kibdelosporangium sp. MJ126-NF4]
MSLPARWRSVRALPQVGDECGGSDRQFRAAVDDRSASAWLVVTS